MSNLLTIEGLYGGYRKGADILQGIDLRVDEGEAVGILGLNGSGKSTLGKAIMNLLPYRRGRILFDGRDVSSLPTHRLADSGIALMLQGGTVFPNLTVRQNLDIAWGRKAADDYRSRLESIIPLLRDPKSSLLRQTADRLSGGQRHELALAMTLAGNPRLLILDEPSAGLAPAAVEQAYTLLDLVRRDFGTTILLIEQNVNRALAFADRCITLRRGQVVTNDDTNL